MKTGAQPALNSFPTDVPSSPPAKEGGGGLYAWGDTLAVRGLREQLDGLQPGAFLEVAVGPEEEQDLRRTVGRLGWDMEDLASFGHLLRIHRP